MQCPSPIPESEELADRTHFLSLIEGMDLPKYRVLNYDYQWIKRNAGVRNATHPKFSELMEFIKRKISS